MDDGVIPSNQSDEEIRSEQTDAFNKYKIKLRRKSSN